MPSVHRRAALSSLLGGVALAALPGRSVLAQTNEQAAPLGREWSHMRWARGIENQRKADLGDGTFLNPIMSGDHPDPSILKDGDDYYMTFSSFESVPGIHIWHSKDLVNWHAGGRGADDQYRLGLGARALQARRPVLRLHPGPLPGLSLQLCDLGRRYRGAVVASRSTSSCPTASTPATSSARTANATCS